ncbi:energy transducer TonB [Pinibacter aurantiacus]|uniref:TonB family protein n=1 Tax=Pinibacter aurantiacus TaxID=2851599 RepID=A0A9E2W1U5_9BACT|nr:energy transducer TonB [Pinibacter aurantiacus]MBV4356520.1 TonB family protein [Pinibacter aurantiacus]
MKFSKLVCLVLLFTCINKAFSQDGNLYLFNEKWEQATDLKKAKYLLELRKVNDSSWQGWYYNFSGPLLRIESYKNIETQALDGECTIFKPNGYIDSVSNYKNGVLDGSTLCFSDSNQCIKEVIFSNGKIVKELSQAERAAGIKTTNTSKESIEIESSFPGGTSAWGKYLSKNLKYPERAFNHDFQGNVVLQFIVLEDGSLTDIEIYHSVEYSLDKEALRMLQKSPKWQPGQKNGVNVKTYKRQPITFRLQ